MDTVTRCTLDRCKTTYEHLLTARSRVASPRLVSRHPSLAIHLRIQRALPLNLRPSQSFPLLNLSFASRASPSPTTSLAALSTRASPAPPSPSTPPALGFPWCVELAIAFSPRATSTRSRVVPDPSRATRRVDDAENRVRAEFRSFARRGTRDAISLANRVPMNRS